MSLTFKSTTPEEQVIVRRGRDGARICKAVQAEGSERTWDLDLRHPDGMNWRGTFHGHADQVGLAMLQMMIERQDERPPHPTRDRNVRVDDLGRDIGAPVRRYV